MMNYEVFKETVGKLFMDYLPEQYKDMQLHISPVKKINRIMDGISLRKKGCNVSPTIYVDDMYKHFLSCNDLSEVLKSAAEIMEKAMREVDNVPVLKLASAKDDIVFQLINTNQNKDLLKDIPHREFLDLSIIYRWVVKINDIGIQGTIVNNDLAKKIGMNEEQLYQAAIKNTQRILPPMIKSMNDFLMGMFAADGDLSEVWSPEEIPQEFPDTGMWVITNSRKINGAISMLYEDNLHKLAIRLDSDLYILPSSVHEVIVVSTSMGEPCELSQMVRDINADTVSLEERLSNNVYHYDKNLRRITLVTDANENLE